MSSAGAASDLAELVACLDAALPNAHGDLPHDLFLLVSRLTPLINVDLLIHDAVGRALLTWREDDFYGPGWHVPGGIIRFKETAAERIAAVASAELGAEVQAESEPCKLSELFAPHRDVRGHFLSLLYRCMPITPLDEELKFGGGAPKSGEWHWFARCPDNLIPAHEIYRPYIDGRKRCAARPFRSS
jgi:colanic acid biosynthesis protein WcaH